MPGWYQRKPSDDARLVMLLQLGHTDIVIAALQLAAARCEAGEDVVPESAASFMDRLEAMGVALSTDETLRFFRMKKKHRGTPKKREVSTGTHGHPRTPADTKEHPRVPDMIGKDIASLSPSPSEKVQEKSRTPAAPRYALSAKACLEEWNQAVYEATGERSFMTGMGLATKAQTFHKQLAAAGETFLDVARRRVRRGKPLNLHYAMNDYNDDKRADAPPVKKTGPDGWNDGDNMNGIPKGVLL